MSDDSFSTIPRKKTSNKKKIIVIATIIVIISILFAFPHGKDLLFPTKEIQTNNPIPNSVTTNNVTTIVTPKITCKPTEYNETWTYGGIHWFCEKKWYYYSKYQAIGWQTNILHTTTAKVLEFKDSEKREITTLANTKFILDNYTNDMQIGDVIKIFEINHYNSSCNPITIVAYNGTIFKGKNMTLVENSNWQHYPDDEGETTAQKVCANYTTFSGIKQS